MHRYHDVSRPFSKPDNWRARLKPKPNEPQSPPPSKLLIFARNSHRSFSPKNGIRDSSTYNKNRISIMEIIHALRQQERKKKERCRCKKCELSHWKKQVALKTTRSSSELEFGRLPLKRILILSLLFLHLVQKRTSAKEGNGDLLKPLYALYSTLHVPGMRHGVQHNVET